jgi:hypothetical protein
MDEETTTTTADEIANESAAQLRAQDADAERQLEIPEKYQRDTPEETIAVLLESDLHAQRKISQQARELKQLRESMLEPEEETYGWPSFEEAFEPTYYEPNPLHSQSQPVQFDPAHLAALQRAAVQHALAQPQVGREELLNQAASLVYDAIPEYADRAGEVMQLVERQPRFIAGALATGDVSQVANALTSAYQAIEARDSADTTRQMKLNAQSATGGGGRPASASAGEQRWQEIASANTGKLGL